MLKFHGNYNRLWSWESETNDPKSINDFDADMLFYDIQDHINDNLKVPLSPTDPTLIDMANQIREYFAIAMDRIMTYHQWRLTDSMGIKLESIDPDYSLFLENKEEFMQFLKSKEHRIEKTFTDFLGSSKVATI